MSRVSSFRYEVIEGPTRTSVSQSIELFQETLRASLGRQLPGDEGVQASALLGLKASPVLFEEVRAIACSSLQPTLAQVPEAAESAMLNLGRVTGNLATLVEQAEQRLVAREHEWLRTAFESSVLEMGYELVRTRSARGSAVDVRARHVNGTVIRFEADARRGALAVDLDGFKGSACLDARRELATKLKHRGLATRLVAESPHCERSNKANTRARNTAFRGRLKV